MHIFRFYSKNQDSICIYFVFIRKTKTLAVQVERTGAVVKPRTLGREVPGSSPPVAVRCGLEQVTYPQLSTASEVMIRN